MKAWRCNSDKKSVMSAVSNCSRAWIYMWSLTVNWVNDEIQQGGESLGLYIMNTTYLVDALC